MANRDSSAEPMDVPTIFYVMGIGRSGTTMMEILLANNPGMVGVGEACFVFRDGFDGQTQCACGKTAPDCPFWGELFGRAGWSAPRAAQLWRLHRRLEYHFGFAPTYLGLWGRRTMAAYHRANRELFGWVRRLTGAQAVVDSSKYAARALALAELFPGRVKVICLVRSPEGLMGSYQNRRSGEQKPKSALGTMLLYLYAMPCLALARRRLGEHALVVAYEEMKRDPVTVLQRVQRWSGVDLQAAQDKIMERGYLEVGHIVTGNRLRHKQRVVFEVGAGKRSRLDLAGRSAVSVMRWWQRWVGLSPEREV